jgi:hypothetical protein
MCSKLCDDDEDCSEGERCVVEISDTLYRTCSNACAINDGKGCPAGWSCYPFEDLTYCRPSGKTPVGGACDSLFDCESGSLCVAGSTSGTCREICRITPPASGCQAGTCTPFATPEVYVGVEYGQCK